MLLTRDQLGALSELVSLGVGRAGGLLSEMLGARLELWAPEVTAGTPTELEPHVGERADDPLAIVDLPLSGAFEGRGMLCFSPSDATRLVRLLTGGTAQTDGIDPMQAGALAEIGSVVLNGVVVALSQLVSRTTRCGVPQCSVSSLRERLARSVAPAATIVAPTPFAVEHHRIEGTLVLVLSSGAFDGLIAAIDPLAGESA